MAKATFLGIIVTLLSTVFCTSAFAEITTYKPPWIAFAPIPKGQAPYKGNFKVTSQNITLKRCTVINDVIPCGEFSNGRAVSNDKSALNFIVQHWVLPPGESGSITFSNNGGNTCTFKIVDKSSGDTENYELDSSGACNFNLPKGSMTATLSLNY